DFPYEHYNHERCFGSNWLLTGASCCQFWFPSAAGVATGLVAARLAPEVLRASAEIAPLYQSYIDEVAASHEGLEWLVRGDPWALDRQEIERRSQSMTDGNVQRLGGYLSLQTMPAELAFNDALLDWFESDRRAAARAQVDTTPVASQATRLFRDE